MIAVKAFWAAHKLPIILGGLVLAMVVAGLIYWQGRSDGRTKADAERAVANVESMKTNEAANTNASDARVADAEQVVELKEELTDAVAQVPDDVPDPVAVALGCQRLRNQGTDTAAIPACGRR